MATRKPDRVLDARGLLCPMPMVRTKLELEELQAGQVLQVLATDPAAPRDIAVFCQETGNRLLSSGQEGKVFTFLVEKG